MTDQEKRQLRIMLGEQAKIHIRKKQIRRQADPKHRADWPDGFTPAELGERAAKRDNEKRRPYWSETLGRYVSIPENDR